MVNLDFEKVVVRIVTYSLQCNVKIEFVVKEDEHVVGRYNIFNKMLSI